MPAALAIWCGSFLASLGVAADLEFAHGLYNDKRYKLAAEEYRAVLKDLPGAEKAAEATFFLGECLVQLGEHREAVGHFETVARDRGGKHRATALYRLGVLRGRLEQPTEAAAALRQFLDENGSDSKAAAAWCLLVENLAAAGDAPAAQAAAGKAESLVDKNHKLRPRLRMAQAKAAEKAGALREAERLYAELAEENSDAAFARAGLLYNRKAFAEAIADFDRAAARSPDAAFVAQAKYNAALAAVEARQWPDADKRLTELLDRPNLSPELASSATRQLIGVHLQTKDFARARTLARDWEKPLGAWAPVLQAQVELAAGESDAAHRVLERGISDLKGPPRAAALTLAARIAAARGELDDAVERLTELRRDFPKATDLETLENEFAAAASWKAPNAAYAKLSPALRTETARLQLQYGEAVRRFQARRDAEAEALLVQMKSRRLPAGMEENVEYLLGLSYGRRQKWSDAATALARFSDRARSADKAVLRSAAIWLGRALAHDSDAAEKFLKPRLAERRPAAAAVEQLQAVVEGLAAEQAHERALDVLDGLERMGAASPALAARCLLELKRPREALAKLPENPTEPEQVYLRGVALIAVGRTADGRQALVSVASATPAGPWSVDAALRLARSAESNADRQAAEKLLRALEPGADHANKQALRIELAMLAADLGRPLEAAAELQAIADSGAAADATSAALKLAEIFEQRGDLLQAERWLGHAEKAGVPETGRAALAYRKASLAYRGKKWDRVEELLAPLEDRFGDDRLAAASLLLRAEAALERGQAGEAVAKFKKLRELPGGKAFEATAALRTGQALLLEKKWREAHAAAKVYLDTSEGKERPAEGWFVQGRALQQQAKFGDARALFEKCATAGDADLQTRARFMIAETFFHQRQHREALKEYLKVALVGGARSWQAAALLQVGQCHEALGEDAAARETYEKALARFPDEPAAAEIKKRLGVLSRG